MSLGVFDVLTDLAGRCGVKNEKILRKSKELISLLNFKQHLNCSDTCKAVVCLELASSLTSDPLSREEAIKYSGCKKRNYTNIYNNISKLLNLDKIYSVGEICILLGVMDVKEPATKALKKFKKIDTSEDDFEHPMYPCAAILALCRAGKVKVNTTKLVEISRVKKLELEELAKKFHALIEEKSKNEKNEHKRIKVFIADDASETEEDVVSPKKMITTLQVMSDEAYEEWKKKMLED